MGKPESRRIQVDSLGQALRAEALARLSAREAGFPEVEGEEIALAVHELATNLVRHAGGGTIELDPAVDGSRKGLVVLSLDDGPGIPDPEWALVDGCSTGASCWGPGWARSTG